MDREIHWFEEHSCYVVRWSDAATPASLAQHWDSIVADPRFQPGFAALHDCRAFVFALAPNQMRDQAHAYRAEIEPQVGFGRVAILVEGQASRDAAQRMINLLELEDAIVTTSEAEARNWVGLPADVFVPNAALPADHESQPRK